jgi:hypothetical protein
MALMPSVMAVDFDLTNATSRYVSDIAYPETIFYFVAMIGAVMIVFDIRFLSAPKIPAIPVIVTATIGFASFLICAYMAPLVAKMVWIVNADKAQFVSTYIFSPWVTYLCLGFAMVCFLLIWYGIILLYFGFKDDFNNMNDPDKQYERYLNGGMH